MKKIVLTLMVFATVFSLSAQQQTANEKSKKSKEPVITFQNTVHDYGTVVKGGNGECEFVFKNTGKSDLILTNVRSSCGCTVPVWPKEPIPKNGKAVIKVKYDTNRVGGINKSITVESNAENNRVVLNIKGNVVEAPVESAPENAQSPVAMPR